MTEQTYIGYHATRKKNEENILKNGYIISFSENDNIQWLGNGVYFWIDDYYAVEWNIIQEKGNNKSQIINNNTILRSILVCNKDKIFDVSSPEGSIYYNKLKEGLKKILIESGKVEKVKELDGCTEKYYMDILQDYGLLDDFDMIIATFRKKYIEKSRNPDNFIEWEQRQICVRNLKIIKNTEVYNQHERISQLVDMILKNRKGLK